MSDEQVQPQQEETPVPETAPAVEEPTTVAEEPVPEGGETPAAA